MKKNLLLLIAVLFAVKINAQSSPCSSFIAPSSLSVCWGQSATLTASGVSSYSWSTGSQYDTTIVTPYVTTTYTVTGSTPSLACLSTATVQVSVIGGFLAITSNPMYGICGGGNFSATLTASGASSYTWDTGATTNSIVVSPTVSTTYEVLGELNNCIEQSMWSVNVNPPSIISAISSIMPGTVPCAGEVISLAASGAVTYTWSNGAIGNFITITTPTLPAFQSATLTYSVTGTDQNGCIANSPPILIYITSCFDPWGPFVGIPHIANITAFIVYPNPVNEMLNVELNLSPALSKGEGAEAELQITTILGELIKHSTLTTKHSQIDVSDLENGIYFLQVFEKGKLLTVKKVIKE